MPAPIKGTIQARVLQVLINHLGEPLTSEAIQSETDRDGDFNLDWNQIEGALNGLRVRGYTIEMDPPPSNSTKSTEGRTFRLLQTETTSPPIEVAPQSGLEVVVSFDTRKEAGDFASALRTVTGKEVHIR